MPIVEYHTVTVKNRTIIKALFLFFNVFRNVMLDSLSYLFTSIFLYFRLKDHPYIFSGKVLFNLNIGLLHIATVLSAESNN